jgi:transposase
LRLVCDSPFVEVDHGQSYSNDLRDRIVAFVEAGHSRRAAARHFGVGDSFAVKLLQRVTRLGTGAPGRQGRPPGGGRLEVYASFLIATVEAKPDITMPELATRLEAERNVQADPAVLSRFLCRHGFTKKSADGVGTRTRGHP